MFGILESDSAKTTVAVVVAWSCAKLLGTALVGRTHNQLFEKIGTVDELYLYPMKSCGVMKASDAFCSQVGLSKNGATDRHWMVVAADDHRVIYMALQPSLTLVKPRCEGNTLVLTAPGMVDLHLPLKPDLKKYKSFVKVFDTQPIRVIDCGEVAGKWMSQFLHRNVKIVHSCPELDTRSVYTRQRKWDNTARLGDKTIFGYITSYLVTTTSSLKHVNETLDKPVPMVRFRPNIVIKNQTAFDEDNWAEVRIGDNVRLHYVEPCLRCIITAIDADSGIRDKSVQPLKQLKSFRCRAPYGRSPVFGAYMSVDVTGQVQVGDSVYVLRRSSPARD